jgi:glycosyltransferase involved in cell wall biosynthesis
MNENKTIVVAIPTYNNEDTIVSTLNLLMTQARPPDLVIFCDKSDDNTRAVIHEYADKNHDILIEVLEQEGDGVADAYDQILKHVEDEYDLFVTLQSNLIVDKNWLAGHERIHTKYPDIDIVNGDHKKNTPTDREVTADERPYFVGRNFSAKAGTLEAIDGWDPHFLRGEDWDMRIRLAGAGTRSYACTDLGYRWQTEDPYITFSKAKRRPTVITFLAKYGFWYINFHPTHIISDGMSFAAVMLLVISLTLLPFSLQLGIIAFSILFSVVTLFTLAHNLLRGGVDNRRIVGPVRKQFLNGIAIMYAIRRVMIRNVNWNTAGFDSEDITGYKF